jgi:histone arginine demethylase JMJD6
MLMPPSPLPAFMARGAEIERRAGLTPGAFAREHLFPGTPVILTDALSRWKALTTWTLESFGERFRDRKVPFKFGGLELTLGEFIPQVLTSTPDNPAPYLTNLPIATHLPELLPEISPLPEIFQPNWAERTFLHPRIRRDMRRGSMLELYIGGPGGNFPVLHWDGSSTHAFLMQIAGVKQYWVWPPDDSEYLYPGDAPNISPIRDVEHPDLAVYPLFAKARATTFTLHPGELLFVPSRWWHTARILSPSITVSTNVLNESNWRNFTEDMQRNTGAGARVVKSVYLAAEHARHRLGDLVR